MGSVQEAAAEAKMDAILATANKERKRVPKDGACMFRCVAEGMYGTQVFHSLLRSQCVRYMQANAETFLPFVVGCSDLPWDHYIFELQKVETWGGYLELMALSKMLKINFTIFTENAAPTMVDQGFKKNVSLAFSGGNHYDLVVNKKEADVRSYCQELVYSLVQKITHHDQQQHQSDNHIYKNIAYECWLDDLKKQESRDQLITKKLLETPPQNTPNYANLSGYYKKDMNSKQQHSSNNNNKEPTKNNKKHNRNKKSNKQSNFITVPNTSVNQGPQSAEDIELQSILKQIEEVEKKQVHHITLNRDFPELKSKPRPPPTTTTSDAPPSPTSPLGSAPLSPSMNSSSLESSSSTIPPSTTPSTTITPPSTTPPSTTPPSTTQPTSTPVNAWKTPKNWNTVPQNAHCSLTHLSQNLQNPDNPQSPQSPQNSTIQNNSF
eukprot:Phypoly_transcript_06953.p1 GENE.Phypoly_transcript_06953~~Phypoly_transcript_06953.p1  ORF type:complete len:436 (+),score=94.95 Phypoly_transcript_06953:127-1434(+)